VLSGQGTAYVFQNAGLVVDGYQVKLTWPISEAVLSYMPVRIYNMSSSCIANLASSYLLSWPDDTSLWTGLEAFLGSIWADCPYVSESATDNNGQAFFDLPQENYVVLGSYTDPTNSTYYGASIAFLFSGRIATNYLLIIRK
jgi:hypothetical protein